MHIINAPGVARWRSAINSTSPTFLLLPPAAPAVDVPGRLPPAPAWCEAFGAAPASDAPFGAADPAGLAAALAAGLAAAAAGFAAAAAARLSVGAPAAFGCFRSLLRSFGFGSASQPYRRCQAGNRPSAATKCQLNWFNSLFPQKSARLFTGASAAHHNPLVTGFGSVCYRRGMMMFPQ